MSAVGSHRIAYLHCVDTIHVASKPIYIDCAALQFYCMPAPHPEALQLQRRTFHIQISVANVCGSDASLGFKALCASDFRSSLRIATHAHPLLYTLATSHPTRTAGDNKCKASANTDDDTATTRRHSFSSSSSSCRARRHFTSYFRYARGHVR